MRLSSLFYPSKLFTNMKILFDWGAIAQTDPPFIYFYVEELASSLCSNVLKNSLSFVSLSLFLSLPPPLTHSQI